MRVGNAALMLLGVALGAAISSLLGFAALSRALALIPIVAAAHELLHLAAIRVKGLAHRFVARGLLLGYVVEFSEPRDYVVCALAPQTITAVLAVLYAVTGLRWVAALALLHVAISINDIAKSVKYLVNAPLDHASSRR